MDAIREELPEPGEGDAGGHGIAAGRLELLVPGREAGPAASAVPVSVLQSLKDPL
jgi:hypothetical protein